MNDRAVLISVKEKWAERILAGEKTVEVRKSTPKLETPFTCYLYQSGTGFIVGEFVCWIVDTYLWAEITPGEWLYLWNGDGTLPVCYDEMQLSKDDLEEYGKGKPLYCWQIKGVRRYETPVPLECFGLRRPPVSWQYVVGRDCHAACGCSQ